MEPNFLLTKSAMLKELESEGLFLVLEELTDVAVEKSNKMVIDNGLQNGVFLAVIFSSDHSRRCLGIDLRVLKRERDDSSMFTLSGFYSSMFVLSGFNSSLCSTLLVEDYV
ncbi:hypothetical protein BDF21DRAFT_454713 [Thamnidium elegans]|nr:hypothetical protein BDF21DRAFT_454713 [Thamnidium elegans]